MDSHVWRTAGRALGLNRTPSFLSHIFGVNNPIRAVTCRAFAKAYPDTVDATFAKHWDTWFTQDDIKELKAAGINTVRVPVS